MVILGLLLLVLGVLAILAGLFGTDTEATSSNGRTDVHATFLGVEVSATTVFVIGAVAAVLVLAGLWFMKAGAKQGWKRRKEQKRLTELSEKLDQVEMERRRGELSDDER